MASKPYIPTGSQPHDYYRSFWNIGQKTRVGPSKKDPISMARVYNQRPGRVRMNVYAGPAKKDGRLATVETLPFSKQGWTKWLGFIPGVRSGVPWDFDIILFPDQHGDKGGQGQGHGQGERIEIRRRKFAFTVSVGRRPERFEWRWSNGGEVGHYTKQIVGTKGVGWKLLRLDTEGQDGSRDGKECVAAFARTGKLSTNSHRYQLFNSGARRELGERFEMYAYLTFLAIVDQEAREDARAAAERTARENGRMNNGFH